MICVVNRRGRVRDRDRDVVISKVRGVVKLSLFKFVNFEAQCTVT